MQMHRIITTIDLARRLRGRFAFIADAATPCRVIDGFARTGATKP